MTQEKPKMPNQIKGETGEFDARFTLWRTFCAEHNVPVDTLPSDLTGTVKERWETLKNERLHEKNENVQ